MSMIPETDKVIRSFLPNVLAAAGHVECAEHLRGLDPIHDVEAAFAAVTRLRELGRFIQEEGQELDLRWKCLVEDSLFWAEAAACAAIRNDDRSFRDHMHRTMEVMKDGASIMTLH